MKISNKAKDYIVLVVIFVLVVWILTGAVWYVKSLFAEEITKLNDIEKMNRFYAEECIKNEMRFLAMWEYTENMSTEEYVATFFKEGK